MFSGQQDRGQAKSGDADKHPHQAASMRAPLIRLQSPQEMSSFPTEFCLTLNRDRSNACTNQMWKGIDSPEKPADPIILGTSPVNYRTDSNTLFGFGPLNFVPIFQSLLPTQMCSRAALLPTSQQRPSLSTNSLPIQHLSV